MKRFILFTLSILLLSISYAQTNVTTCDSSYTWTVDGNTYTQSGTFSANSINNNSMSFDGSGDVVSFSSQVIPINGSFTISFWAYPNSFGGIQEFMHQNHWINGGAFYIGLDGSEIRCGDTWQNTTVNIEAGKWQYISVVRHYNSHVDIYIDGALQASKSTDISMSSSSTSCCT